MLAYCLYNEVDWKDIAYIQQLRKIDNATNIQVELQGESWLNQLIKYDLLDLFQVLITYKPYLMMGDVYMDFINKKDHWDINIRDIYSNYSEQVREYLENMAARFISIIQPTPGDESELDQDWLKNYAKALRNMTEKVIDAIRAKKSLNKDQIHDAIAKISQSVLSQLDGCDKKSLEFLDNKTCKKLTDFMEALRKNVKKVTSVPAYTNAEFFTPSSEKSDKAVQTEEENVFSP